MRENYRNSIASVNKFPQFTTMNVIDGQAGLIICASLIFYSLTIDNILNNIVYCFDTSDVLKSAMIDKYYESERQDTNKDFIELVEENKEPNTQYLRYWHGTMIFLRPLLVFFSIQEIFNIIFNINYVIMCIIFVALLIVLLRKNKKIALLYVIAMITIAFPIVAISWLYSWTYNVNNSDEN